MNIIWLLYYTNCRPSGTLPDANISVNVLEQTDYTAMLSRARTRGEYLYIITREQLSLLLSVCPSVFPSVCPSVQTLV